MMSSLLFSKDLLQIQKQENLDQSKMQLESLLESENFVLVKIPKHENSLYLAVARALFYQQQDFEKLYYKACNFLQKSIQNNELNDKLEIFKDNMFKFRDYCYNPNKKIYEKINIECLSQSNQVAIHVYSINWQQNIQVIIFNNKYEKTISLFQWNDDHFDVIYQKEDFERINYFQKIIDDVIAVSVQDHPFQGKTSPIRKRSLSMEETVLKSLTEEKNKQSNIFKNINTNSNYLKNLIENNDNESQSRKTSLFFSDDLLGYNLKSMRINVKDTENLNRKPSFQLSIQAPPGINQNQEKQQQEECQQFQKPRLIIENYTDRFTGKLKFFDHNKSFGFIIRDSDNKDIFLHQDDCLKSNIPFNILQAKNTSIRFSFVCMQYIGKYKKSQKAVDLKLIDDNGNQINPDQIITN